MQQRRAAIEAVRVRVAQPLPPSARRTRIPGLGPTLAAIGDLAWDPRFSQLRKLAGLDSSGVATGNGTGTTRISKGGRPLLRWALYQAALGAARPAVWRARREAMVRKRQGDRFAFLKANTELAAKLWRLVWGVWRRGRPYAPARVEAGPARSATAPVSARAGRRGTPPSGQGPAEIAKPKGSQTGRMAARRASRRSPRPSGRA